MRTFKQFMKETIISGPNDPRTRLTQVYNMLTLLEPPEIEDSKDILLKLQILVDDIVSGNI